MFQTPCMYIPGYLYTIHTLFYFPYTSPLTRLMHCMQCLLDHMFPILSHFLFAGHHRQCFTGESCLKFNIISIILYIADASNYYQTYILNKTSLKKKQDYRHLAFLKEF